MTQEVIENIGTKDLRNYIESFEVFRIFLVTGKSSYNSSGAQAFIEETLGDIAYERFSEFEQNPKYEDAVKGSQIFQQSKSDFIIAIGGGSVIDMAKLINTFTANSNTNSLDLVTAQRKITKKGVPLVAIPTTAGTGSEATHFAVVYHNQKKYSVAHPYILPDLAGLNYSFILNQPKYLASCAGLDAVSQAIESYWSVGSTDESRSYAKEALRLLLGNLDKAINAPSDISRKRILKGAYLAGKAINISKTTAAHAVSYAFTSFYGIPHGHAVFLTLPEFFEYNYNVKQDDINDSRGVDYIKNCFNELMGIFNIDSPDKGKQYLKEYAQKIGVELALEKLGILDCEVKVAKNVNLERLGNNPRKIAEAALVSLLKNKD